MTISALLIGTERQGVASDRRYSARMDCRPMTDPLEQLRAQKALVDRLTTEVEAVQAHLAEVAQQLDDAENNLIVDAIEAYDNGVTPQEINGLIGMQRQLLHYYRNAGVKRRVR